MSSRRGRGEGTIVLRQDGRWSATITVVDETGKAKRKAFYGKTRAEAVAKMAAAQRELATGRPIDPVRLKLGDYLDQWLRDSVKPSVRPRTMEGYQFLVRKHITPALGHIQLQKLTPQVVQRFLNTKTDEGLSSRTVQFLRAVLRRALAVAVRWGLIPVNVAALTDAPKPRPPELRVLEPPDIKRLLEVTKDDRLGALYIVTLALGLRRGEVLGLRWSDVDWTASALTVEGSLQRVGGRLQRAEPKTRAGRRAVVMPQTVVAALRAQKARQAADRLKAGAGWQDTGLVFTTGQGTAIEPRNLNRAFSRALDRAGLPQVRFHDLRHTTCSILLAAGVPVKAVADLLGHADASLTLRVYSHTYTSTRQAVADSMDDLLAAG